MLPYTPFNHRAILRDHSLRTTHQSMHQPLDKGEICLSYDSAAAFQSMHHLCTRAERDLRRGGGWACHRACTLEGLVALGSCINTTAPRPAR